MTGSARPRSARRTPSRPAAASSRRSRSASASARGLTWRGAVLLALPLAALSVVLLVRAPRLPALTAGFPARTPARSRRPLGPAFWLALGLIVSVVAVEFSTTFWAADLLHTRDGLTTGAGSASLSALLVGMTAGRLLAVPLTMRVESSRILLVAVATSAAGWAIFWSTHSGVVAVLGLVLLGLGLAFTYPLGLVRLMQASDGRPDTANAVVRPGSRAGERERAVRPRRPGRPRRDASRLPARAGAARRRTGPAAGQRGAQRVEPVGRRPGRPLETARNSGPPASFPRCPGQDRGTEEAEQMSGSSAPEAATPTTVHLLRWRAVAAALPALALLGGGLALAGSGAPGGPTHGAGASVTRGATLPAVPASPVTVPGTSGGLAPGPLPAPGWHGVLHAGRPGHPRTGPRGVPQGRGRGRQRRPGLPHRLGPRRGDRPGGERPRPVRRQLADAGRPRPARRLRRRAQRQQRHGRRSRTPTTGSTTTTPSGTGRSGRCSSSPRPGGSSAATWTATG